MDFIFINGFNPRPYTRGDVLAALTTSAKISFNPRPYTRGDNSKIFFFILSSVSIHAPTRGATDQQVFTLPSFEFQSTPLHEGRLGNALLALQHTVFQSTPLHEGRPLFFGVLEEILRFQSTPLHEGRPNLLFVDAETARFQSTPLHEGRLSSCILLKYSHIYIVFRESIIIRVLLYKKSVSSFVIP